MRYKSNLLATNVGSVLLDDSIAPTISSLGIVLGATAELYPLDRSLVDKLTTVLGFAEYEGIHKVFDLE